MPKSIFSLFGGPRNPTTDWPDHVRQDLTYDLRSKSVNGYSLNAPLEDVRIFGKCDECSSDGEYLDLYYRPSGLVLKFASRTLLEVDLVVSQHAPLVLRSRAGRSATR